MKFKEHAFELIQFMMRKKLETGHSYNLGES